MRIATVAGELYAELFGPSSVDLLLWPGLFFDNGQHRPLAKLLAAQGIGVALVDPPGCGRSGRPPAGLTVSMCGEAMGQVGDALQADKPCVGGTSWGGIAALHAVLEKRLQVRSLLLLNTPVADGDRQGSTKWIPLLSRLPAAAFALGAAPSLFAATSLERAGRELRAVLSRSVASSHRASLQRAAELVLHQRPDLRPRLAELEVPALVLCGAQDAMCPVNELQAAWRGVTSATVVTLDDSGHSAALEEPAKVATLVQRFVAAS